MRVRFLWLFVLFVQSFLTYSQQDPSRALGFAPDSNEIHLVGSDTLDPYKSRGKWYDRTEILDWLDISEAYIESKAITVESPTNSENITLFFTDVAIEVLQVNDVVQGTTPSVTYNIEYASTRDAVSPTSLWTSDRTTTSESGAETTSFNNASIPAGSWIWLTTSATSGTNDEINVTVRYR